MKTSIRSPIGQILTLVTALLLTLASPVPGKAQRVDSLLVQPAEALTRTPLDSLVHLALERNPALHAASQEVAAARARVGPAGILPDPMLEIGIQNFPLGREAMDPQLGIEGGPDPMTMRMIGIGQSLPFPGKLSLHRRAAEHELAAAEAELQASRWQVREEVVAAYAELVFLDRSLEVVTRSQTVLSNLLRVTETRYGTGQGGQQDVLRARVELTRLGEEAVALNEGRLAVAARLNALLDQPSDTPLAGLTLPDRITRAAVAEEADRIRFSSTMLGARAADSPIPPLAVLQEEAVRQNPMLRAHGAMIAARAARLELARKAHLPDFDLSLLYGQRPDRPDMLSAMVSIPLPVRKSRLQDQGVVAAEAEVAALHARHQAEANEVRAEVARLVAELERERARLALFVRSILPQGRASLESATVGFQVARVEFMTLLENQATLFELEVEYHRALSDFASTLAQLETMVGKELLP